jgi:probable phosphoglycerate mutase
MPTRLLLIRHGESNVTVRRVIGGHRTCDGLSPLGVLQSERLAARWAESDEVGADVLISPVVRRLCRAVRHTRLERRPAHRDLPRR